MADLFPVYRHRLQSLPLAVGTKLDREKALLRLVRTWPGFEALRPREIKAGAIWDWANQLQRRCCLGKASPFCFAGRSAKGGHIGLVLNDPLLDRSLRQVTHWHRNRCLQEKSSIAFLYDNHGVAQLIEAHFASERGW